MCNKLYYTYVFVYLYFSFNNIILLKSEQILQDVTEINILPPYHVLHERLVEYPLPDLLYGLKDLEPQIEETTMNAHYLGHHETYRKKMNAALKEWRSDVSIPSQSLSTNSLTQILINLHQVPKKYFNQIRNNVGGYVNHALYWSILSPNPERIVRRPGPNLLWRLEKQFHSFDGFRNAFTQEALNVFGSGYVWLVTSNSTWDHTNNNLSIVVTVNQDCPLSNKGLYPILVIDLWEHAYYLKHQYRRVEHLNDWWSLIDWDMVDKLEEFWRNEEKLKHEASNQPKDEF